MLLYKNNHSSKFKYETKTFIKLLLAIKGIWQRYKSVIKT